MRGYDRRSLLLSLGGAFGVVASGSTWLSRNHFGQENCSCRSRSRTAPVADRFEPAASQDGDQPNPTGDSVRHFVAKCHGDIEAVRASLKRHPEWCHAVWDWGLGDFESPLGAAAHSGRADIAELLIEHGASPDLFASAMMGHVGCVRQMTRHIASWQRAQGSHRIPLVSHAIAGGQRAWRVVRFLLDQDVDVNACSRLGYTPLMTAACFDNDRAAGWLLERGADPGRRNHRGLTAEQIARKRGHERVASLLAMLR